MLRLSLLLGRRLTRPVLHGIAAYFFLFSPTARRHSRAYLRRALSREPRLAERYGHVLAFASSIHDRVFWLAGRERVFEVELHGVEHVLAARSQGEGQPARGIMFVGAHVGSFEALRILGERHGIATRMLMYEGTARKLGGVLAELDPGLPARIVALGRPDSMLRVRDALAAGECVGALADRHFDQQPGTPLPFLGEVAEFPRGPFQLAALLGVPTVFMAGLYLGGNRYVLRFSPLFDFSDLPRGERQAAIAKAQAAYVATLEATCRAHPLNWFNFFDFWRRSNAPE
jgi:predicted LPLAT superfamily acyltransferase